MDDKRLWVTTDDGKEVAMEILFTFGSDVTGKNYVLFHDPDDDRDEVFVMSYDEDGNLNEVDEQEWDMAAEMLDLFQDGELEGTEDEEN